MIRVYIDFGGFYGFHDEIIDDRISMERAGDDFDVNDDVDYKATYNDYADNWLNEFASEFDIDIKFSHVDSPRFYNYRTDLIAAWVSEDEAWRVIRANCESDEFGEFIEGRFENRDGFVSYYDDFNDLLNRAENDDEDLSILFQLVCEYLIDGEALKYDVEYEIFYTN